MKSLERRIQKIEERIPQLPCPNPKHDDLRILMYGVTPAQDRENDELIESDKNCEYCKAREATRKGPSIIMFRFCANRNTPENPAPEQNQKVSFEPGYE